MGLVLDLKIRIVDKGAIFSKILLYYASANLTDLVVSVNYMFPKQLDFLRSSSAPAELRDSALFRVRSVL